MNSNYLKVSDYERPLPIHWPELFSLVRFFVSFRNSEEKSNHLSQRCKNGSICINFKNFPKICLSSLAFLLEQTIDLFMEQAVDITRQNTHS